MDKIKTIKIHQRDISTNNNINFKSFHSLINWENNQAKLWIDCSESITVIQNIKKNNIINKQSEKLLSPGFHSIDILPIFGSEKTIEIFSEYEKEENIIINENFGFNRWLVNLGTNMTIPPNVNWNYISVSALWNDNATWSNLNSNEILKHAHEIDWIISQKRKEDINEIKAWCTHNSIPHRIIKI